jgi:hypothetical protein
VDQQLAKIAIASLGDPGETGLAARRDLPGHEAEPRGKVSSALWPSPIAAARAVAFSTPMPGIVARLERRGDLFRGVEPPPMREGHPPKFRRLAAA